MGLSELGSTRIAIRTTGLPAALVGIVAEPFDLEQPDSATTHAAIITKARRAVTWRERLGGRSLAEMAASATRRTHLRRERIVAGRFEQRVDEVFCGRLRRARVGGIVQ